MYLEKIKSHANIIIGDNDIYIKILNEIKENKFEYLNFESVEDDKNFKLENISVIKNFISQKSEKVRYVISNKNLRLTNIQSAMLKMLEENTNNTIIIFVASNVDQFLKTILSRTQVLNFSNNKSIFSKYKKDYIIKKDFKTLEKLVKLENLYNKNLVSEKRLDSYFSLLVS